MNRNSKVVGNVPNQQRHLTSTTQPTEQQHQQTGIFSTASNILTGSSNTGAGSIFSSRGNVKGPQIIPQMGNSTPQQQQNQQSLNGNTGIFGFGQQQQYNNNMQQGGGPGQPNLMQKIGDITAPGGDILSKGKELIFMKFGLGGK